MNILILTNMGSKPSSPYLGEFVKNQYIRLKEKSNHFSYFDMAFNGDTLFHQKLKYFVFFMHFLLRKVCSFKKYDLIHVHYYFPTIILALTYKFIRNSKVKIVVTCHGGDIYLYQPPNKVYRYAVKHVDHWIFTSNTLKKRFFCQPKSSQVLCAGFDERKFYPQKSETLYDCLLVGNLDHNKGIDRLMKLVLQKPNLRFAVIGKGTYEVDLYALEKKVNNLTVLGAVKPVDLPQVINSTMLLLSLSRNESFGLVIAEAHACGVPCLATKTDGSYAQVTWPDMLIEQHNEHELISEFSIKLDHFFLQSPLQRTDISAYVIKQSQQYSLDQVSKQLLQCYNRIEDKSL